MLVFRICFQYASDQAPDGHQRMRNFFVQFSLSSLSEEQRTALNSPITKNEVIKLIK